MRTVVWRTLKITLKKCICNVSGEHTHAISRARCDERPCERGKPISRLPEIESENGTNVNAISIFKMQSKLRMASNGADKHTKMSRAFCAVLAAPPICIQMGVNHCTAALLSAAKCAEIDELILTDQPAIVLPTRGVGELLFRMGVQLIGAILSAFAIPISANCSSRRRSMNEVNGIPTVFARNVLVICI